ncbi:DUF4435 domain-containing protein [Amantichitinum ursilacus]|uniref:DUF4435 domain-containing protein n=1 Tax=Amantichitinum ursilacus TaxID=857265 RepID=UPI0013792353|nr:DUF4435 domain-containing protein [Amantichitinum ursilacus]
MEGQDDLGVYKNYWFSGIADKAVFKLAETGPVPLPGCNGVERNVLYQRAAGIQAYGLVDRDAVEDSALSCTPDDSLFLSENMNKNPNIYYTLRWELENYLIDAVAWEQERVNSKTRGDGRRPAEEVMVEIFCHCDILVAHAAANALLHSLGKPKIGDGFGTKVDTRADFEDLLFAGPFKGLSAADIADYSSWKQRIEAFDLPHGTVEQRVFAISRRIHGKALLERFFKKYSIQDDKRFSVASRISGRIPQEIALRVAEWVQGN